MDLNIASNQTSGYKVMIPVFEGPLDLLLKLIEHSELEITAVSLSLVTEQYLLHIRGLEDSRPEQISAFLVIAAKLIQIKSEALLPRPVVREASEEDPAEALAEQLRQYKRFKELANSLEKMDIAGKHTYIRVAEVPKLEGKLDISELSLEDLVKAAQQVFQLESEKKALGTVISAPKITIRQKILAIGNYIRTHDSFQFRELLSHSADRLEVVVTFLALLELIKRHRVNATQELVFGEIQIQKSDLWVNDEDFDLEFE